MFSKKIRDTTFTRGAANDIFTIGGEWYMGDRSFTATLRALLHKRSHGESVSFSVRSYNVRSDYQNLNVFEEYAHVPGEGNSLRISNLVWLQERNEFIFAQFDDPQKGFSATHPNYAEAKDLQFFVRNRGGLNARFYISRADKDAIILCEELSLPTYHLLQALIPRLFPYYFEDAPLDTEELSLLDSLTLRTATEYERILDALSTRIDFRGYAVKKILKDFENSGRRDEVQETRSRIDSLRADVERLGDRYSQCIRQIDELSSLLAGQEMALAAASGDSELIEYFMCNRNIEPVSAEGRSLLFTVKTYLESFDPEQFRVYSRNLHSHLYVGYSYTDRFKDVESRKRMLEAIFSDEPILRVKMCSNYVLDLRGSSSARRFYEYGKGFEDYVPNPHINQYACLGDYARYINAALQRGDLIGAIEQCIASAKSLNLAESITVRALMENIFCSTRKIIRLPDGTDVTPDEAFAYLTGLEEKKEEEQNV